ncbi:MAG: glycoside hydrolase family 25 protein [Bacillota bacterium]|nr:glycoside hydrolase family 25 protein [Bacillota bacterium]
MKTKLLQTIILILCVSLLLSGCAYIQRQVDPHAGMVEVFNGTSNVWIEPQKDVPVNTIIADDFVLDPDGNRGYCGGEYSSVLRGVDVSEHQQEIDWQQAADSGVKFAIIRAGGRYYGEEGALYEDDFFKKNLQGAIDAGLDVGVYFFSQAINEREAVEEAEFALSLIDGAELKLPVFIDWERIEGGRAYELDGDTMTSCAEAFCETVRDAGYEAGVYFNLDTGYYGYELARLTDYMFWCACPGDYPYCYYAHDIWQCSFSGSVPGINGVCDLNMMFIK